MKLEGNWDHYITESFIIWYCSIISISKSSTIRYDMRNAVEAKKETQNT